MKNVVAVARRELAAYFNSPVAYIVLGVFLAVSGWVFFFFPGVFFFNKASMRAFFDLSPVLFMFLTPAITMRLVAEERKSGTLEGLLTLPVTEWQVILGKASAALGMVMVGLACTLLYPLVLTSLVAAGQSLDWGPIVGGYMGLVLLAAAFIAMGVWASAVSRNQIVAFILALLVAFVFWILDKAAMVLPSKVAEVVAYLGVGTHFENIARGVIDTRDVLYYVTVAAAFLIAATGALRGVRRTGSSANIATRPLSFLNPTELLVLGSLVLVNIVGISVFTRFDLTRDHAFTLAEATKDTLHDLENPVKVTAYFSEDLPPQMAGTARAVGDLLNEYHAASGGQVSFEFIDPLKEDGEPTEVKRDIFGNEVKQTALQKELEGMGITPARLQVMKKDQVQLQNVYLGLAVRYGEEKDAIPVIQDISTLEYDLTSMIRRLTRAKLPVVGITQGHGEPDQEQLGKIQQILQSSYTVKFVTLSDTDPKIDDDVDALFLIGPTGTFSDAALKAVDAFMMKGKAAAFFVDRNKVDLQSFQPTAVTTNIDTLLSTYGIEVGSQLVGDVDCATLTVGEKRGMMMLQMPVKYPFIPQPRQFEGDSPMTKGLGDVPLPFAVPLYPKKIDGVDVTTIAKSSAKSWLEDANPEGMNPRRNWGEANISFTGPYTLIAQARGLLPSQADPAKKSEKEARVVVIGTSAFTADQVLGRTGAGLLINIADWLSLDAKLLAMKTRGVADAGLQPDLSDGAKSLAQFGTVGGSLALLVLLGVVRASLRNRRRRALAVP